MAEIGFRFFTCKHYASRCFHLEYERICGQLEALGKLYSYANAHRNGTRELEVVQVSEIYDRAGIEVLVSGDKFEDCSITISAVELLAVPTQERHFSPIRILITEVR